MVLLGYVGRKESVEWIERHETERLGNNLTETMIAYSLASLAKYLAKE